MSKLPNDCICLFYFQVGWGGGWGWFEGYSTLLIHYKKTQKTQYKMNNNNKTNTKHEFNVKYERY
jgi:hypothetical protein